MKFLNYAQLLTFLHVLAAHVTTAIGEVQANQSGIHNDEDVQRSLRTIQNDLAELSSRNNSMTAQFLNTTASANATALSTVPDQEYSADLIAHLNALSAAAQPLSAVKTETLALRGSKAAKTKKATAAPTSYSPAGYGVHAGSEIPCTNIGTVYFDDYSNKVQATAAANYYKAHGDYIMYQGQRVEITFLVVWLKNPLTTPYNQNTLGTTIVPKGSDLHIKYLQTQKPKHKHG